MLRTTQQRRVFVVLTCLAGFAGFESRAMAGDERQNPGIYRIAMEGSTPTLRQQTDSCSGCAYIYVGGSFPAGTHVEAFQYLFGFTEFGNSTGYVTPLLFESEASGEYTIYTVRGIGRGFSVSLDPDPKTLPFDVIEGTPVTNNDHFTFGFINALISSDGGLTATSMGVVEFDNPADGGDGEGGPATTNQWAAGDSQPSVIMLGTTFGVSGSGANYGLFSGYRTYSAPAGGVY